MKGIESPWGAINLVLISWEQEATLPGTSKSQPGAEKKGSQNYVLGQAKGLSVPEGPVS